MPAREKLPTESQRFLAFNLAAHSEVKVLKIAEHGTDTAEEGGAEHEPSRWGDENEGDEEDKNARFYEIGE